MIFVNSCCAQKASSNIYVLPKLNRVAFIKREKSDKERIKDEKASKCVDRRMACVTRGTNENGNVSY